jgi:hypothetical protein
MTDLSERPRAGRAYPAGFAIALAVSFLTLWTTIVRDDGSGLGRLAPVMAAAVAAFAVRLAPAGLARAALGVAVLQILIGLADATAPSTAAQPHGALKALAFSGVFAVFWLGSAACMRAAASAKPASS